MHFLQGGIYQSGLFTPPLFACEETNLCDTNEAVRQVLDQVVVQAGVPQEVNVPGPFPKGPAVRTAGAALSTEYSMRAYVFS